MGPERYLCLCGEKYLTGAREWDRFSDGERRRRVWDTFGLGVLLSLIFAVVGLLVYLALHFFFGLRRGAVVAAWSISAAPFLWMQTTFWPGVLASMWRTRFGASIASERK